MKVLYVYEGKMNGHGLDLVADYQLRALSHEGIETDFVSRGSVDYPGIDSHKIVLNPAKLLSWRPKEDYYGANRRFVAWRAAGLLRKNKYDGVVAWAKGALSVFQTARRQGIPTVLNSASAFAQVPDSLRVSDGWPRTANAHLLREYALSDRILAPSERTAAKYISQGIPKEKVVSIGRGFDEEAFYPASILPSYPFRAIFCGNICERKGVRQLVEGWRRAELPESAELWFAGSIDGDMKSWADEVASPSIRFLGFQKKIGDLMRQCHVHVLLSRNESMGKSLIEAAACGLPNLTTEDVGLEVREGVTGFVVDRNDPEAIAARLIWLYGHPKETATMGKQARQEVAHAHTWGKVQERFIRVINDVQR